MTRYVALLAGINVGGNRLTMADLRDALEREEFEAIETVVASGNVLFDHEERPSAGLAEKLAWVVRDRFDIETFAIVMTRAELAAAIAENPFSEDGEEKFVHTIFFMGQPEADAVENLILDYTGKGNERIAAGTNALHVDYVDGAGNSKLTGDFIERRLGMKGTARNMRSMKRILAKMDEEV
ncbi:DUF1697 domain-containing protein [Altererythrobacter sp.]|uniref:DUF1697 domain-containing protein n=1 Tax=Altererythrobacter sp. TaxID=1872480 RepID=UPI003CFED5B7